MASSITSFNLTILPLLYPPSAVIIILDLESSILSLMDAELNPENITV
jgi:hypothetical protein